MFDRIFNLNSFKKFKISVGTKGYLYSAVNLLISPIVTTNPVVAFTMQCDELVLLVQPRVNVQKYRTQMLFYFFIYQILYIFLM